MFLSLEERKNGHRGIHFEGKQRLVDISEGVEEPLHADQCRCYASFVAIQREEKGVPG